MFAARQLIYEQYYSFYLKLVAISIDGFKSDRYEGKIKDMVENISNAQKQLQDEELLI